MRLEIQKQLNKNQNIILSCTNRTYAKICKGLHKSLPKKLKKICVVTTNKSSDALIKQFQEWKIDPDKYYFIDCVSAKLQHTKELKNCAYIRSPQYLTGLSIAIPQILKNKKIEVMVLDNISTLLLYNNELAVTKFLHHNITQIKSTNVKAIYLIMAEDLQKIVKTVSLFADAIIEMK